MSLIDNWDDDGDDGEVEVDSDHLLTDGKCVGIPRGVASLPASLEYRIQMFFPFYFFRSTCRFGRCWWIVRTWW